MLKRNDSLQEDLNLLHQIIENMGNKNFGNKIIEISSCEDIFRDITMVIFYINRNDIMI